MTVSSQTSKVSYSGNGSTVAFTVTFYFIASSDIKVLVRSANGTEVVKTLNTDYTVTGAGDPAGGTVTFTTAPISGETVVLARSVPLTQITDYTPNDPFPAETHERALDKLTQVTQQINEAVDRSIKLSLSNTMTSTEFTVDAATRANKILGFDAAGELSVTQELGTYRGNWTSGTAYVPRDIIKDTSNANIYICLTAHTATGSQPISSNTDVAKWALLVDAASAAAAQAAAEAAQAAAETAEANAETAETNAETAQAAAELAEANAKDSETAAALSESATSTLHDAVVVLYDNFDDRYLGTKSSNPTVDNDGNTLLDGALYWNTTDNEFRVYDLGATTWRKTVPSSAEQANINTVSGIAANVTTVAGISANVTTVAGISANVTSVAGNSTNINTVATDISNVNSVGTNIANVNAVAGNATNINAVNANATNINTVAGINANVTTVAGISANVTTVAGISANVTSVAGNASNINQVASDTVAINSASANATSAAASALSASNSATSASASAAAASAVALGNEPVRHSVRPSLLLDFANTKTLDPRITFTRASTGTYYDGKTVAKAEENLLLHSEDVSQSVWLVNVSSKGLVSGTNPIGVTQNISRVTASGNGRGIQQNYAMTGTFTLSVWLRTVSGSGVVTVRLNGINDGTSFTITSDWVRYTVTGTGTLSDIRFSAQTSGDVFEFWGAQLEQRSSVTAYTATTTAPITNYIPALQTAASGVARFEHNPVTGESLGLEIEEQRTNLFERSEEFDNAYWTKLQSSIQANLVIAPDGLLTGDKFITSSGQTLSSILSSIQRTVTKAASAITYTLSCYAKKAEHNRLRLVVGPSGFASSASVTYSLVDGSVVTAAGSAGGFTGASSSISDVGNGWYRVSLTFTTDTSTSFIVVIDEQDSVATTGDGFSGIYIWGAQLEAGAFATSYIPTVASQVTRSQDSATMTGTNFSSWYRADEGTVYAEGQSNNTAASNFPTIAAISAGTTNNQFSLLYANSLTNLLFDTATNSVTQASITVAGLSKPLFNKMAAAYKTNDFAFAVNNTLGTPDTAGLIPVVDVLKIGRLYNDTNYWSGCIKKIAYYGKRLSNAELQGLTTN